LPILKSGVIDEMAYTLFNDGSIERNARWYHALRLDRRVTQASAKE
jgi:hypothetical protein